MRALDTSPGNLRPAMTSFIGRDPEVTEIKEALRGHGFVTLTGVGGVGKTRLATGGRSADLRRIPRRSLAFRTGGGERSGRGSRCGRRDFWYHAAAWQDRDGAVAAALEGRVGCWYSTTASTSSTPRPIWSKPFSLQSATVRILATSREGLGVADEQLWRVPSFDVDTAVELFVERARSVSQDFSADKTVDGNLSPPRRHSTGY